MTSASIRRRQPPAEMAAAEEAAAALAQGLAQAFGPIASFHVCRVARPEIVIAADGARRPGGTTDVLAAVSDYAAGSRVASRPAGRGSRMTVLPLPGGSPDLALVITVETGPLARAARVLASLADPGGTSAEAATEHLGSMVSRLLDSAEAEFGQQAAEMSRGQKQDLVRYLDERGAFLIKKSVEQVAVRLGVSRFTIYNYLDQANREDGAGQLEPAVAGTQTRRSDTR